MESALLLLDVIGMFLLVRWCARQSDPNINQNDDINTSKSDFHRFK